MLPFAVRLRAHGAGLETLAERVLAGSREPADLLALAEGPLPLLGALVSQAASREAQVVGLLPVRLLADVSETVAKALAHRAAAEAEVIELSAQAPCTAGALDLACETARRLLVELRGAIVRIDEASIHALAAGAGITAAGAASRLAQAGVSAITARRIPVHAAASAHASAETPRTPDGSAHVSAETARALPLPVRETWEIPSTLNETFVAALLAGPRRQLAFVAGKNTTGIVLTRAVALARLAGHGPIAVGGGDELKGPDACLAFGASVLEAELDPPGTLGSRTRHYGEAAVRGAQLALVPPRRKAAPGRKAAHILDEQVDPSLLPENLEIL